MVQVIKLRPSDKKKLKTKFNFVARANGRSKGFKTLKELNRELGMKLKSSSFKGKKPAR